MQAEYSYTGAPGQYSRATRPQVSSLRRARYRSSRDDTITKFRRLVRQWRAETVFSSSMRDAIENDKFKAIVSMGPVIVPLIIEEITTTPDFLVVALPLITGDDPTSPSDQGDLIAITDAWVKWWSSRRS